MPNILQQLVTALTGELTASKANIGGIVHVSDADGNCEPAIVLKVNSDKSLNLAVFEGTAVGVDYVPRQNVPYAAKPSTTTYHYAGTET